MHDVVAAAAEVLVQARVVGVELVVGVRRGGVRGVGVALLLAHGGRVAQSHFASLCQITPNLDLERALKPGIQRRDDPASAGRSIGQ